MAVEWMSLLKRLDDSIRFCLVDNHIRAHALRHFRARGIGFDRDDKSCASEFGARRGAQADRTLCKHRDRVTELHFVAFSRGNSRGRNVGQEHDLLIGQIVRNLCQVRLRARNEQVLRLRVSSLLAVDSVPEFPPANRSAALRPIPAQAVVALTTRSDRSHEDAVAYRIACPATARLSADLKIKYWPDEERSRHISMAVVAMCQDRFAGVPPSPRYGRVRWARNSRSVLSEVTSVREGR
jgi:hypothetical protein